MGRYAHGLGMLHKLGGIGTNPRARAGLTGDLYVSLGEPLDTNGTWALRLYVKPWIRLIWLGAILMSLGAFVVVFDRRFRRPVAARTAA